MLALALLCLGQIDTATVATTTLTPELFAAPITTFFEAEDEPAPFELRWGGALQSNVRYRYQDKSVGEWFDRRAFRPGIDRNEHIVKLKLRAGNDRFRGVIDVDLVWLGRSRDVATLGDLTLRERAEPTRFEAHAAYVEALDIFLPGLDLRVGQQIVSWGVGDQFNPTNNLNANDVEDKLLFGAQQANLMARLDYTISDRLALQGVLVPVFRPALLPASAPLGVALVDRLPHVDPALRQRILAETAAARIFGFPTVVETANVALPENTWRDAQVGLRVAATLFEQDIALSWYRGRTDIPFAADNFTRQVMAESCNPNDSTECIDGQLRTTVTLSYPQLQVVGLNLSGEVDLLGWATDAIQPLGYRVELGVYFPKAQRLAMRQTEVVFLGATRPAGEYAYPGGERPLVLDDQPFAKWVVGLDYTFNEYFYTNVQWVHGLVDELGAGDFLSEGFVSRAGGVSSTDDETLTCAVTDQSGERCAKETLRRRLGDYLVWGLDFHFDSDRGLLRLFTIFDLTGIVEESWSRRESRRIRTSYAPWTPEGYSLVLFPELNYNFGNGLELGGGALMQLGKPYSKFGDPAAGGSVFWTRARYSF